MMLASVLGVFVLLLSLSIISTVSADNDSLSRNRNQATSGDLSSGALPQDQESIFARLSEQIQKRGEAMLIVELNIDFQPESRLASMQEKIDQRNMIKSKQDELM